MVSSTNGIKTWLWGTRVLTFVPWLCCNSPVWIFFSLLLFPENTASTLIINIFLYFITVSICWEPATIQHCRLLRWKIQTKFQRNNWIPGVSLSNVIPISYAKQTIYRGVFQDKNLHNVFQKKLCFSATDAWKGCWKIVYVTIKWKGGADYLETWPLDRESFPGLHTSLLG